MVAKSYQALEQLGEPFTVDSKMYINVRLKSGKSKSVRWYNEKEYAKIYPDDKISQSSNQKDILGFSKGYVTIFKEGMDTENAYFQQSEARYHKLYGWYFVSEAELPFDLPFEPIRLPWGLVGNSDGQLKSDDEVETAVANLLYPPKPHEFNVSVGDRLEIDVVVEKNITLNNQYGHSNLHRMKDAGGNLYIWITSAKNWCEGSSHRIRGTVKETKVYRNEPQVVLTRCIERD